MKIHNNKTKTTTAIISALVIGLILLSPTTMLPNVGAQTQIHSISTNTSKSPVCNTHTLLKQLPPFTSLERQKAISLAEESPVFLQKAGDNTYTLSSVGPSYAFDEKTCSNFTLNAVGVYFKLGNGSSLDVYEDGNISKITGARIPHLMSHSLSNIWSGYEAYYQQTAGTNSTLIYSNTNFGQPSVGSSGITSICYAAANSECDLSNWGGLQHNGRYLAQTGTDAYFNCTSSTSCGSQQNTAWFEFIDSQSSYNNFNLCPSADVPNTGDPMNPVVENGPYAPGGGSSDYETVLVDNSSTNSWICTSGGFAWPGGSQAPDTALSMIETPVPSGYSTPAGLPTFSSISNTGNQLCYGSATGSCTGTYTSTSNGWDYVYQMQNCPPAYNISEGSMSSSSAYTSTYNNSDGTGNTVCT